MYSEQIEQLAAFMHHLIQAGMSIEDTANQGFLFALRSKRYKGDVNPTTDEMLDAAKGLERASQKVGLHLDQQRASRTERGEHP